MTQRLQRLDWLYTLQPVYFVTACTAHRRKILAQPVVHEEFRRFCESGRERGTWVGAYVLMPDHLHLFVAFDDARMQISPWVKALKGSLSARLREREVCSPFWQKGFFDHILRSSESYSEKWEYVQRNPVRAGLVSSTEEWPYIGEINRLEY